MTRIDAAAVEPLLTGRFGKPYLYRASTETTQRLLDASAPEGAVAVADEQTAGRGRMGRSWQAAAGSSILVSILLRPPDGRRAPELTLVGGVATALAIERATGLAAQLKWPNDVMLEGHKVAGGIAELKDGAVVLGIGINVNQAREDLPTGTKAPAGSLRTVAGRELERAPLLADLLLELERRYDAWSSAGLGALHEELDARDFLRGRHVAVDGVEGEAAAIGLDGRLHVRTAAGLVAVESGEVVYSL